MIAHYCTVPAFRAYVRFPSVSPEFDPASRSQNRTFKGIWIFAVPLQEKNPFLSAYPGNARRQKTWKGFFISFDYIVAKNGFCIIRILLKFNFAHGKRQKLNIAIPP